MIFPHTRLALGKVKVEVYDGYTVTCFEDGLKAIGLHDEQPGQKEISERLGMTARAMNEEHDLLHSELAAWLGLPWSPALRAAALGVPGGDLEAAEGEAVLALQRYKRLAGL